MSDSELSDAPSENLPADSVIESSLIKEVKKAAKGPAEAYTVGKIRTATEKSLGLTEGFFKTNEKWKDRSKTIIKAQVDKEGEPVESTKAQRDSSSGENPNRPTKRNPPKQSSKPNKKRRIDSEEETSALSSPPSDSEDNVQEETKPKKPTKAKKEVANPKAKPSSKQKPKLKDNPKSKNKPKSDISDAEEDAEQNNNSDDAQEKDGGSESEMSVVLDDAPVKKQRSKSAGTDASSSKSKPKTKSTAEPDPNQEEIKRLQGWLVKCGVRKVWGKELKPFDTPKAKIKHLKGLLEEVGMTGRYSNEKAAGIKEARELAADIEAVQEGNERWGKDGDDEEGDGDKTRSGRRLVRGAKNYDFLSSDGEETD